MAGLSQKHALITGGGTGVGAEIARELARAGAAVTIAGRRSEPLRKTAATHDLIEYVTADITNEASVARMFNTAEEQSGPVDIVIANAGSAESAPFARTSTELWSRMLEVNLTGTFFTLREGLARMKDRDWGRLIAIASTAGLKGYAYTSAYCAAKHGVVGLIRALALETAGSGITANAACPGFTDTPMLEEAVANIMEKTGMDAQKARAALAGTNPMGRLIKPQEVAAAVLWLSSEGADAVTGQSIAISGGETW